LLESILNYVVCPVCLNDLELNIEKKECEEIVEGKLICTKCEYHYPVHGGIPILTPPGTKPYDWLSRELTDALKRFEPKVALKMISEGEIGPKRLVSNEPVLTLEELKEGESKDSERSIWLNRRGA